MAFTHTTLNKYFYGCVIQYCIKTESTIFTPRQYENEVHSSVISGHQSLRRELFDAKSRRACGTTND